MNILNSKALKSAFFVKCGLYIKKSDTEIAFRKMYDYAQQKCLIELANNNIDLKDFFSAEKKEKIEEVVSKYFSGKDYVFSEIKESFVKGNEQIVSILMEHIESAEDNFSKEDLVEAITIAFRYSIPKLSWIKDHKNVKPFYASISSLGRILCKDNRGKITVKRTPKNVKLIESINEISKVQNFKELINMAFEKLFKKIQDENETISISFNEYISGEQLIQKKRIFKRMF